MVKEEGRCKADQDQDLVRKQEAVPLQGLAKEEAVPLQQELVQDPETNLDGGKDPRNEMLKIFESICTKYGGPSQYLLSRYSSSEAVAHFGEKLQKHIRQMDLVRYFDPKSMQPMNKEKLALHVTMLGFDQAAITKPLPYPKVCIALADEYLTHTFLS